MKLCERKETFEQTRHVHVLKRQPWGSGEEWRVEKSQSPVEADESYFFDEDGQLVGALFAYPGGLKLKPYPVLRDTLSQLKPDMEFYLRGLGAADRSDKDISALYMTGDETSTTQYVTTGKGRGASLLLATIAIDPYSTLMSPYQPEFLSRAGGTTPAQPDGVAVRKETEGGQPFASRQNFARGQTAQLGYCGDRNYERAADAYRKALGSGFTDAVFLAETHHRLGVSLEAMGKLKDAESELQRALAIRPNTPEIINNLGSLYAKMGQRDKAMAAFERAVSLRPNYSLARYNLAEVYETVDGKRAISEYETYLALVDGVPEEASRAEKAKARVKMLKGK